MLKHLGSVKNFHFYENTSTETFVIFHKSKRIAHPTTIEEVLDKMQTLPKLKNYGS